MTHAFIVWPLCKGLLTQKGKPASRSSLGTKAFVLFLIFFKIYIGVYLILGFPGGSEGKESACNEGELGLIPGLGRSPGERNGNPL